MRLHYTGRRVVMRLCVARAIFRNFASPSTILVADFFSQFNRHVGAISRESRGKSDHLLTSCFTMCSPARPRYARCIKSGIKNYPIGCLRRLRNI